MYSVVYVCQLLVIIIRIRYCCLFVSIHSYSSVIIRCSIICFIFIWVLFWLLFEKKKNNSEPEPCSGISILRYPLYEKYPVPVDYYLFNIIII